MQELIVETDRVNLGGIKVSIMQNTAFLAQPKTIGEIYSIMNAVNSFIDFPNSNNKANVENVIERLNEKF